MAGRRFFVGGNCTRIDALRIATVLPSHCIQKWQTKVYWSWLPEFLNSPAFSWLFAIGVSAVVAIDVSGLILSQYKNFSGSNSRTPRGQALLHASWHAGLFFGYMIFVTVVVNILYDLRIPKWFGAVIIQILDLVATMFEHLLPPLSIDVDLFRNSLILLVGITVIIFVWFTYKSKLVENHKEKMIQKSAENPLKRVDVRFIYEIIRKLPGIRNVLDHALALAVAVDMLAVSALIRVYFKDGLDTGYDGWHIQFLNYVACSNKDTKAFCYSIGGTMLADLIIFASIIFAVVLMIAFFVSRYAISINSAIGKEKHIENTVVFLRFIEPLPVFIILAFAIEHLIGVTTPPGEGPGAPIWVTMKLALGLVLWGSLIFVHGCKKIRCNALKGIGGEITNTEPLQWRGLVHQIKELFKEIIRLFTEVYKLFPWIFSTICIAVVFLLLLAASHLSPNNVKPLEQFVNWWSGAVVVATAALIFLPRSNMMSLAGLAFLCFALATVKYDGPLLRWLVAAAGAVAVAAVMASLVLRSQIAIDFPVCERRFDAAIRKSISGASWRDLVGVTCVYFSVVCHAQFPHSQFEPRAPWQYEPYLQGLLWLGAYGFSCYGLLFWRKKRQQRPGARSGTTVTTSDALTVLGLVNVVWVVILTAMHWINGLPIAGFIPDRKMSVCVAGCNDNELLASFHSHGPRHRH
ncbi:MAG: hypothetical protein ABL957_05520 [Parvularculaceae bacterium]